jgi:hypothetical protein
MLKTFVCKFRVILFAAVILDVLGGTSIGFLRLAPAAAAQVVAQALPTVTASGAQAAQYLRAKGVTVHKLSWSAVSGTNTTCTVALDSSKDGVTYTAGNAIAAQDCTVDGFAIVYGTFNYVRVNVTAITGAGNTVAFRYEGFNDASGLIENACKNNAKSVAVNISTATTTSIVAPVTNQKVYICGYELVAGGADNVTLEYGTGATCGTGTTAMSGVIPLAAQAAIRSPYANALGPTPVSQRFCILTSGAVALAGYVSYAQF